VKSKLPKALTSTPLACKTTLKRRAGQEQDVKYLDEEILDAKKKKKKKKPISYKEVQEKKI
jgi:hypothetical protein